MAVKVKRAKKKKLGRKNSVALNPGLRPGDVSLLNYLSKLFPGGSQSDEDLGSSASKTIHAQIDPILSDIDRRYGERTAAGQQAIKGYTDTYLSHLGDVGKDVRGDWAGAQADDQKAAGALSSFLQGEGQQQQGEVAAKLKAAGAPQEAIDSAAGGAASLGHGAGGEFAARGYAQTSADLGKGAAQTAFADTLPGIGAFEGAQAFNTYTDEQRRAQEDERGQITSQIPGLVESTTQSLRSSRDDKSGAKAQLLASFLGGALDRNTQAAIAKAGLGKDYAGQAIDWSNVLGFKTDAHGNPVLGPDGNLIPTSDTVSAANSAAAKAAANRNKAVGNRGNAKVEAQRAVASLVGSATKQQYDVHDEPIVLRTKPNGQKVYKKQGGGLTTNPGEAETHSVKTPLAKPGYDSLVKRAMQLPEIQDLARRYAVKPAELRSIIEQALASAGISRPKAKPQPAGPRGEHGVGYPGNP